MIITVPLQGLQNAGEISNKGIEFAANYNPDANLELNLTYSYTGMKNIVYATPQHNLFASWTRRWGKLRTMASLQHINHLDTDPSSNSVTYETYTLLNAKVSYLLLKWCDLFISAENILNQEYENNIYYTMPGITAFGGLKLKF